MSRRNTYDPNQTPAAKRRQLNGKRRSSEFDNIEYRPDMSEYEIMQAWEWENSRDWTQHLPSVQEQARAQREIEERHKRVAQRRDGQRGEGPRREGQSRNVNRRPNQSGQGNSRSGQARNSSGKLKLSFAMKLYTLSVVLVIMALLMLNLIPLIFLAPILLFIVVTFLRLRKRRSVFAQYKALFYTGVHSVIICAVAFVIYILAYITGFNYGVPSLGFGTENVYISGIDTYGDISSQSRSDVNLLLTYNQFTGQSLLTTTPRDYYVTLPGVSQGEKDKLTHAGIYGVETSMSTLANLYGVDVESYIRVNFSSLIDIVDAMGGVTIDSAVSFTTGANTGEVFSVYEGENYLNGAQALAFARERYSFADGDAQRGRNQQVLLKGLLSQMFSMNGIKNLHKVILSVAQYLETDMSLSQMQGFIKSIVKGALYTEMLTMDATGTGSKAYCYSHSGGALYVTIPDESSVNEIKSVMAGISSGDKYYKGTN